jgi:hypothetical protein
LEVTNSILQRELAIRHCGEEDTGAEASYLDNVATGRHEFRMTKFSLDNLFKSQENMHIEIDPRFKRVTNFEIFPQALFHAKLQIAKGANSPVVILLSF